MSMDMNREAYEKLCKENIEWLMQQPRTLERDHIIEIVKSSPELYYRSKDMRAAIQYYLNTHECNQEYPLPSRGICWHCEFTNAIKDEA